MKSLSRKIIAAVAVLAIGAVAGPWVYINLIKDDAPEALTLSRQLQLLRQNHRQLSLSNQQQRLRQRAPLTANGK